MTGHRLQFTLPEGFSFLTTLRKLIMDEGYCATSSLKPILPLPQLEHLSLHTFGDEGGDVAGLPLESLLLTKLEVYGNSYILLVCFLMMKRADLR